MKMSEEAFKAMCDRRAAINKRKRNEKKAVAGRRLALIKAGVSDPDRFTSKTAYNARKAARERYRKERIAKRQAEETGIDLSSEARLELALFKGLKRKLSAGETLPEHDMRTYLRLKASVDYRAALAKEHRAAEKNKWRQT